MFETVCCLLCWNHIFCNKSRITGSHLQYPTSQRFLTGKFSAVCCHTVERHGIRASTDSSFLLSFNTLLDYSHCFWSHDRHGLSWWTRMISGTSVTDRYTTVIKRPNSIPDGKKWSQLITNQESRLDLLFLFLFLSLCDFKEWFPLFRFSAIEKPLWSVSDSL